LISKKIIGVIPARYGSTRLPGKSLILICGKPLIQHVVERAAEASRLSDLMVATDDKRIADVVERLGHRAVMTGADHPSGTDRIAEAVENADAEIVINIQGDEPLIDPELINGLADVMSAGRDCDMATAAVPLTDETALRDPAVVKVVVDKNGNALYFSRSVIPYVRDSEVECALYRRHVGIYAYKKDFLMQLVETEPCALELAEKLEQLRALYIGGRIMVMDVQDAAPGVDTEEDVKKVEKLLQG
jgi:3-deoxy-manno-octulosonate cytidylyltransferase (CMP-KDO synthetase)